MTILFERDVPTPMRDGTVLRADVFRDDSAGQVPVLLLRTPYSKDELHFGTMSPIKAVEHGYAVVLQDCRGRYRSDGEFHPFLQEIDDGYDTVEWCGSQDWSNGRVGMYGTSYMGATPWLAAVAAPPSLRAIFPLMTGSDYHDGWIYQGGAFYLGFTFGWTAQFLALPDLQRSGMDTAEYEARAREISSGLGRLRKTLAATPLNAHPFFRKLAPAPYFDDWLDRPDDDDEWSAVRIEAQANRIQVPALGVGGWYDLFAAGPVRNFLAMREGAATQDAREGQRLIMGPWNHGGTGPAPRVAGAVDFGWQAELDYQAIALRWFDWWLRDIDPGDEFAAPVRYFTMGTNEWQEAESWPPAGVESRSFYLHSGGRANSVSGDGALSEDACGTEAADHFLYHPLSPVPTIGGGGRFDGAFDQRSVEARQDVLVYSSAPLREPLEVSGPISVELFVESSAVDTDFTAKLVEVSPGGFARNLSDNIARTRYRLRPGEETLMEPGRVYPLTIDLLNTSNRFLPGTVIRLEVTSSSYPRFDRNPNTGELAAQATDFRPATQTIHHSSEFPSRLILPVQGNV